MDAQDQAQAHTGATAPMLIATSAAVAAIVTSLLASAARLL